MTSWDAPLLFSEFFPLLLLLPNLRSSTRFEISHGRTNLLMGQKPLPKSGVLPHFGHLVDKNILIWAWYGQESSRQIFRVYHGKGNLDSQLNVPHRRCAACSTYCLAYSRTLAASALRISCKDQPVAKKRVRHYKGLCFPLLRFMWLHLGYPGFLSFT